MAIKIDQKEMMEAGVHLGHRTSRLEPRMADFVVGIRNTVHVIDLEKTEEYLKKALEAMAEIIKNKGVILFVSTKVPLKNLVRETAQNCGMPYVIERWLGGTFTNFGVISKRAQYYKDMKEKKEKGDWEKYTKKEKAKLTREFQNLETKFAGMVSLTKTPEAIFVCDIVKDKLPIKEAAESKVKIIAMVDTNGDPLKVDYPIPANDDAISSVKYILEAVKETILEAKKENSKS